MPRRSSSEPTETVGGRFTDLPPLMFWVRNYSCHAHSVPFPASPAPPGFPQHLPSPRWSPSPRTRPGVVRRGRRLRVCMRLPGSGRVDWGRGVARLDGAVQWVTSPRCRSGCSWDHLLTSSPWRSPGNACAMSSWADWSSTVRASTGRLSAIGGGGRTSKGATPSTRSRGFPPQCSASIPHSVNEMLPVVMRASTSRS